MNRTEAIAMYEKYRIKDEAARHSGLTYKEFRELVKGYTLSKKPVPDTEVKTTKSWRLQINADAMTLESVDDRIDTLDKAIAKAKIDTAIWEVKTPLINFWEMPGGDGKVLKLCQIKANFIRKVPKSVEAASNDLYTRMSEHSPKYNTKPLKRIADPHALEICLFDHHFGKLAWGKLTGSDYDLPLAEQIFKNAAMDLVAKSQGFPIEMFQIPFGNDFLHVDGLLSETVNGTRQDCDGRYEKVFTAGCAAIIWLIEYLYPIAPVNVTWVPGNHDRTSSYHAAMFAKAWFRLNKRVVVNTDPQRRKYWRYGTNLLGYTHGERTNDVPAAKLPLLMAEERSQDFADTTHHEWHLGHLHKAKETSYLGTETHGGVRVRVLPSLSGVDAWHFENGFCTGNRAAEAYLWSKQDGYVGHFNSPLKVR